MPVVTRGQGYRPYSVKGLQSVHSPSGRAPFVFLSPLPLVLCNIHKSRFRQPKGRLPFWLAVKVCQTLPLPFSCPTFRANLSTNQPAAGPVPYSMPTAMAIVTFGFSPNCKTLPPPTSLFAVVWDMTVFVPSMSVTIADSPNTSYYPACRTLSATFGKPKTCPSFLILSVNHSATGACCRCRRESPGRHGALPLCRCPFDSLNYSTSN